MRWYLRLCKFSLLFVVDNTQIAVSWGFSVGLCFGNCKIRGKSGHAASPQLDDGTFCFVSIIRPFLGIFWDHDGFWLWMWGVGFCSDDGEPVTLSHSAFSTNYTIICRSARCVLGVIIVRRPFCSRFVFIVRRLLRRRLVRASDQTMHTELQ